MPTYSYYCGICKAAYSIQQHMLDDPHFSCPSCGITLARRPTAIHAIYHGSGFYTTDNRAVPTLVSQPDASVHTIDASQ